jgi:protocatechuate 3,4-dioxygenase, beta subunit
MSSRQHRRHLVLGAMSVALGAATTVARAQDPRQTAAARTALPSMTEGPFYPPVRWRQRHPTHNDWDADLTRVQRGKEALTAQGEHLDLQLAIVDARGRPIDGADVEIWQCDIHAVYQHPDVRVNPQQMDPGFQGFGAAPSGADGQVRFRTIKPVVYPGRTPHIHIKLRHASFGEWTSQLFVANEPANDRDGIWRRLSPAAQAAVAMQLQAAGGANGLRWRVNQALVLPA